MRARAWGFPGDGRTQDGRRRPRWRPLGTAVGDRYLFGRSGRRKPNGGAKCRRWGQARLAALGTGTPGVTSGRRCQRGPGVHPHYAPAGLRCLSPVFAGLRLVDGGSMGDRHKRGRRKKFDFNLLRLFVACLLLFGAASDSIGDRHEIRHEIIEGERRQPSRSVTQGRVKSQVQWPHAVRLMPASDPGACLARKLKNVDAPRPAAICAVGLREGAVRWGGRRGAGR